MADNTAQTGTDTIATDDVTTLNGGASSGVKVQRTKVTYGDDGTARDVSTSFPLPAVTPNTYATGTITAANTNLITGAATANSTVVVTVPDGHAAWDVYVSGTFSAGTILYTQGSLDGTNWFSLNGRRNLDAASNETTQSIASDFVGGASPTGSNPSNWRGNLGAIRYFRITCGTYTASDSIAVQVATSSGVGTTFLNTGLPASTATIGAVKKVGTSGSAITSVTAAATSTQLLAANTNRVGATFFNESTAVLYLALATSASTTAYTVQVPGGGYYELPGLTASYLGAVFGIWSAANGAARVTELT